VTAILCVNAGRYGDGWLPLLRNRKQWSTSLTPAETVLNGGLECSTASRTRGNPPKSLRWAHSLAPCRGVSHHLSGDLE
jgi:hypothetical protein